MIGPVVVGLDDPDRGGRPLALAAREAAARGSALWLAHVYSEVPTAEAPDTGAGSPPAGFARRGALARLDAAKAHVGAEYPGLLVETLPLSGPPAHALVDAAARCAASLLVVGGRGLGGFTGQMLGSVSLRVLTLARCPVLVVRGDPAPESGRVMLGVDLTRPGSCPETTAFAFEEAELRGASVYAFHAWDDPSASYPSFDAEAIRHGREAGLAAARSRLEEALASGAAEHPRVPYTGEVLAGSAAGLLVESTGLVDLLVIGGKVRDKERGGMRIGALAHTVLHRARCPVAVVPEH